MPTLGKVKMIKEQAQGRTPTGQQHRYNTTYWRELSARERTRQRWCQACLAMGVYTDITPGQHKGALDHVVRVQDGGSFSDGRNLMALCARNSEYNHHEVKSALEANGLAVPSTMNEDGERVPTKDGLDYVLGLLAGTGGAG